MFGTQIDIPVEEGSVSALDLGGDGMGVLLVHGSWHNAAAWADVAPELVRHCHPVAVDLLGHGQTRLDSTDAEQ